LKQKAGLTLIAELQLLFKKFGIKKSPELLRDCSYLVNDILG